MSIVKKSKGILSDIHIVWFALYKVSMVLEFEQPDENSYGIGLKKVVKDRKLIANI